MAKRARPLGEKPLAMLAIPRNRAKEQLVSRAAMGEQLLEKNPITSRDSLDRLVEDNRRWEDFNSEMLRRMFTTNEYSEAFERAGRAVAIISTWEAPSLSDDVADTVSEIRAKINNLISLAERIDLIGEIEGVDHPNETAAHAPRSIDKSSTKVFIVHGRDEQAKSVTARFVEHCGLSPVILHEQADLGRTIIEKFEQEADVAFAIVLLTPDDTGGLIGATEAELKPRARQNVVLELGYFVGKLGRNRVCALMQGDVELPSDISGVIYTPMGADEGWKIKVARELKAAGYAVDMNKALG